MSMRWLISMARWIWSSTRLLNSNISSRCSGWKNGGWTCHASCMMDRGCGIGAMPPSLTQLSSDSAPPGRIASASPVSFLPLFPCPHPDSVTNYVHSEHSGHQRPRRIHLRLLSPSHPWLPEFLLRYKQVGGSSIWSAPLWQLCGFPVAFMVTSPGKQVGGFQLSGTVKRRCSGGA
jgi:hypothetical protein